jgi:hypothetical protein
MVIWLFVVKETNHCSCNKVGFVRVRMLIHANKGILFIRQFGKTRRGKPQYFILKVTYEMKIRKRVSVQPDEIYEPSQYSKLYPSEHSTQRTANQQLSTNPFIYSQLQMHFYTQPICA